MRISDWSSDVCSTDLSEQLTKREDGPLLREKASDREDALVDHPLLRDAELDARGGHQMPDQPAEEDDVAWSLLKRAERRKPGRHAVAQRQIRATGCPHIDLGPSVLVDENLLRAGFLEIGRAHV